MVSASLFPVAGMRARRSDISAEIVVDFDSQASARRPWRASSEVRWSRSSSSSSRSNGSSFGSFNWSRSSSRSDAALACSTRAWSNWACACASARTAMSSLVVLSWWSSFSLSLEASEPRC
eukprot:SAG11_NODE_2924_length_2834_cov_6.469104_3_plen_120_part_01